MNRKFINLQQFAEEDPNGNQEDNTQQGANETNPQQKEGTEKKYTDEDVNKILNQKFAEWSKKKDKEVSEAQKLASMNAQQKAEYQRDKLQKELDEFKRKDALSEMSKQARKMLSDNGISVTDELLTVLVTDDAEKTKQAVDAFASLFNNAVKTAVANELKGPPPKTGTGSGLTKEQILAIKDRSARQKAINENLELFK